MKYCLRSNEIKNKKTLLFNFIFSLKFHIFGMNFLNEIHGRKK